MDDILSQGTERPPGWRPVVATLIAVAAVIALLVARHLPHEVTAGHPPAPAASGPVQLAGLGSGAAALLNHGRASGHACTPHAQVPADSASRAARTRLDKACSASVQQTWPPAAARARTTPMSH